MQEIFDNDDEPEIIENRIMQTEIKNALSTSYGKVPKFNLKIYTFVYDNLVDFPPHNQYDSFTTKNFFINFHRYIKMKIHLLHSHVTGKIIGYSHDFCNTMVIEREPPEMPFIAHNLFGFDFFNFIKYVAKAWCSKALSTGGSNLTHVNILNIISSGKGVTPYEIVTDMKSFFLKPEKEFWEITEFYSEFK